MKKKHIEVISGRWIIMLAIAMAFIWSTTNVMALTDDTWTGAGADNLFSNPANWYGGVAPPADVHLHVLSLSNYASDEPQIIELDRDDYAPYYIKITATGNRDFTINSIDGNKIGIAGPSSTVYQYPAHSTKVTFNCEIEENGGGYFKMERNSTAGGIVSYMGGYDGDGNLLAVGAGESELGGSNSFAWVYNYDGEIVVKHPHALGVGLYGNKTAGTTLSLSTNATIYGDVVLSAAMNLGLKDSGTNDVTLTCNVRVYPLHMITVQTNAGTSTGHLTIRLPGATSTHQAQWNLTTNSTVAFTGSGSHWGAGADNDGSIGGSGSVLIDSVGTVYCDPTNSYTGGTTIENGILLITGDNRLPLTGDIVVESGATFGVGGKSQTVGGLSGNGTVSMQQAANFGVLTVNGTMEPGMSAGTLTILNNGELVLGASSTSLFELDSISGTNDKVAFTVVGGTAGDLTLGGTLQIENLGGLEVGSYTLFDLYTGGVISGSYSSINLPSGYSGILTTSGDVVLEITAVPPKGTIIIIH